MRSIRPLLQSFALLLLASVALAGSSEWKTVRGTKIKVLVPEGFAIATKVEGFQSIELRSTVMVKFIPRDMATCRLAFTKEMMASRGWTLLSSEDVKVAGGDGALIHLEIPQQGVSYRKWISLFEDEEQARVVSVHGVYPKELEEKIGGILKESVLSARFADKVGEVRTAALPFTLKPVKPLEHAKDHGPAKIYTEAGAFPLPDREYLFLIAAPSTSTIGVADRKGYAEKRVKTLEGAKDVKVSKMKKIEIDGLPGYEVLAKGKDKKTGESIFIYQVILYEEVQYYVIAGIAKYKRKSKAFPVFKKTAATFQREKS